MHVIAELPFIDLRPFLPNDEGSRLLRPTWPLPLIDHDFVRHFGVVRQTPGGGLHPWSGEEYHCDASSAVTFTSSPARHPRVRLMPKYRRLLTNGVVGRIEIAFQVPNSFDIEDVAETISTLPIRARGGKAKPLVHAGIPVARLYLTSTTPTAHKNKTTKALTVVPGPPLVLIERRGLRGDGMDTIMEDPESGILLEHRWSPPSDTTAALWVISHGPSSSREAIRHVRVHAMRLHGELQAFTAVLRACLLKQVRPDESEPLRDYLHESSKRILRPKYDSLPQRGLLDGMSRAHAESMPDVTASINEAFANVRPSLARLVADAAGVGRSRVDHGKSPVQYVNVINTDGGKIIVGDNNIEIGEKAQVRGAVGRDITIENSQFGDTAQPAGAELTALLSQLIEQLRTLGPQLDSDGEVQVELATMAQAEATSDEPAPSKIRALISSIFNGIREAGEAAGPAIRTVEEIQNLLQ